MRRSILWLVIGVFLLPAILMAYDYPEPVYLSQWGSPGSSTGQFLNPRAIAVSPIGMVYVADASNHRVQEFSRTGIFVRTWGSTGSAESQFNYAEGIAVDSSGDVYVSDFNNHRVQKFDGEGAFIVMWGYDVNGGAAVETCTSSCKNGVAGSLDGQFNGLLHLAVDASDNLLVADYFNHRIQKFNKNGGFLAKWGSVGTAENQFVYPSGVAVDQVGNVYVGDRDNHRVQKFNSSGTFVRLWGWGVATGADSFEVCTGTCLAGTATSGDGGFTRPMGVAIDARGDVYVVDQTNNRVQKFDSDGNFLMNWGKGGSGEGDFIQPTGIAINPFAEIYVSATVNHRVQRFRAHPLWFYEAEPLPLFPF